MLYFFMVILVNLRFFDIYNFSPSTNKQWKKLVIIILQNTEKISKIKNASENIISPNKISSQYMSQKLLILGNPLRSGNTLQASN